MRTGTTWLATAKADASRVIVDKVAADSRPARAAAQDVAISHGKALKREHSSAAAKVVMCSRLCSEPCTPLTTSAIEQLRAISRQQPA